MEYSKPELKPLAPAVSAIQGSTIKRAAFSDNLQVPTTPAYEADE